MQIKIETFDLTSDELITSMEMNLLKPDKQAWLINHLIWACNNNAGVQIQAIENESLTAEEKQARYEAKRAAWNEANGTPASNTKGRDFKLTR